MCQISRLTLEELENNLIGIQPGTITINSIKEEELYHPIGSNCFHEKQILHRSLNKHIYLSISLKHLKQSLLLGKFTGIQRQRCLFRFLLLSVRFAAQTNALARQLKT